MAFIIDTAFDSGLSYLDTNGIRLDINFTSEATNYTEAVGAKSAGDDTVNTGAPTDGAVSGRRVIIPAITAGSVTDTQTVDWWALTDASSILLATGDLSAPQAVTSGNTFTLDAISITFLDAVNG